MPSLSSWGLVRKKSTILETVFLLFFHLIKLSFQTFKSMFIRPISKVHNFSKCGGVIVTHNVLAKAEHLAKNVVQKLLPERTVLVQSRCHCHKTFFLHHRRRGKISWRVFFRLAYYLGVISMAATSFYMWHTITIGPNKLECLSLIIFFSVEWCNTLAYWTHS